MQFFRHVMQFLLFKMTRYNKSSIDRQMTYWRFNGSPKFVFKVLFMASLSSGVKKTLFVVNCSKEYKFKLKSTEKQIILSGRLNKSPKNTITKQKRKGKLKNCFH